MKHAELYIKKWGKSLGVRLPTAVARVAGLRADQRVRLTVKGGHVIIEPVIDIPLTLAERLERFDPKRHGGETMQTNRNIGAEQL